MDLTRGSFSQVKKAMKKEEEKVYAIKVIPLLNYNKEHLLREVKALAHLEYKFIVRYYTFWWGESVVSRLGDSEEDDSTSDSMEINRNSW
uniref:non-specific serine/threonine protein kinase n=1 Tax=Pyxicephalus adspersus TaxID=30357 RepID=A0AAV3BC70_PYXAD|nr:TPA: hypothetical protein GDO54_002158 [Pyxicephalus adspersus]